MERKKKLVLLVVVIGLVGTFWVWQAYFNGNQEIQAVWQKYIKKEEHQEIQASGTIEATTINLSAKMAGPIKYLEIKSGDMVERGQLIAELSRNDLMAQREMDELSVTRAEANLADLLSGARSEEIREAEINVNIALDNMNRAVDELERLEVLFESGAVSQVEHEKAQTALEINEKQVEAASARLSLLQAGSRKEMISAAQAEVDRNKAILKSTDAVLEDLKIFSPTDGVVLTKNYEVGEYVTTGASVATIVDMDDLWIKVYIPTDDLPRITLGQKVTFTVSGLTKSFEGIVEEIATQGEFTPKTIQTREERTNIVFAVKIRINSEGGILKPGMPADVVFNGGI